MTANEVVPFTDDQLPVDVDDTPEPAGATEAQKAERAERRKERAAARERERKQLEDDLKTERAERQALAERLARMEGTFNASQRPAQQADPYKARLDAVYAEQAEAYRAVQAEIAAKTFTPDRERHYNEVSRRLEETKAEIIAERTADKKLAQSEAVNRQAAGQQVWRQQYPDVYENQRAYNFAQATFQRRLALGEKDSPELVHEVMAETRVVLKLGGKPAPTSSEKARMAGIPSSGNTGGETQPNGIVPTPQLRRIAEAMYSDLPPDKAFAKWVQGPGKELRKQKIL